MDVSHQEPQFAEDGSNVKYQAKTDYVNINATNPQQSSTSNNDTSSAAPRTEEPRKTKWPKWTFAIILMIFIVFLVAAVTVVLVKVHQLKINQPEPVNFFSFPITSCPDLKKQGETKSEYCQIQSDQDESSSEVQESETNQPESVKAFCSPITSCLDLKNQGETRSGYYLIQPDQDKFPFEAYCDMATSDGGWTLVASVHENDIRGRCTTGDMWFSNERKESNGFVSRNWENKFIFGTARTATSSDYKNPGYYAINASDVLVRHAVNDERIERTKDTAFLEYHTENQFLKTHGGNLHGVYSHQYNLSTIPIERVFVPETEAMLDALAANASDIISQIPDFYHYQYGSSTSSSLLRGGNDNMFSSYGLRVSTPCHSIIYGTKQSCASRQIFTSSRKTTPFFALTTIGHNLYTYFRYRASGYRYPNDTVSTYGDTLTKGNFTLRYNAYCRSGNFVPSLCDVMYVVSNKQQWKSSDFSFSSLDVRGSYRPYNANQELRNDIKNIVFGYTMLSRPNGSGISEQQISSVVQKILIILSRFPSIGKSGCDDSKLHLVQPVKYTIGGDTVLGGVPTSLQDDVTPGFMQFRARNEDGVAFAFCPAVRVNTCDSRYLCVGGVGSGTSIRDYCNDYLNWNSESSLDSLNFHDPGSTSRSRQYIESTMLFFYR